MNKRFLFTAAVAITIMATISQQVQAASATALAKQVVIAALSIINNSDLDFGSAPQGDPAKVVAPADPGAANFLVSGEPNAAYSISLPASAIMSIGGGGSADTEIVVNNFASSPNSSGSLDISGNQTLTVGASRAALSASQMTGSYVGSFTVTVVYQ